ncbi:thymidine kinase [Xylocopilactobacillus apicola]|uniref:Thymidine kinase n=1 Tax=Xylocopilactobacillus apicola TaxID=2932184 RepID=A0AAU9DWC0_9LACO|nr:thymidine kinase [Xylocopilactobacillus apicola]BDR58263.1 thymidine kinase [Xylocopilactobacillus apicola]
MAQLFFNYGAMNSGKSIEILKVAHNYEEEGKKVLVFTSGLDSRFGNGKIRSRIGIERVAEVINPDTDFYEIIKSQAKSTRISCILIDEAQFLSKQNVVDCARIVDEFNIPVMAFGLKNDFQNHLFEGTQFLLLYADKFEEIKTICWFCDHKATMNLRLSNNQPIYEGEQFMLGGNESYLPVCREHYFHPKLKELQNG